MNEQASKKISVKQIIFVFFSISVTVGVFGYLFKNIEVKDVVDIIKAASPLGIVLFVIFSFAQSFFRTWRYKVVLQVSGFQPSNIALYLVTFVRNLFSDMLPARLGTLSYIFMVNTRLGIPFASATSSFALAFLFDIIAITPLLIVAVFLLGSDLGGSPLVYGAAGAGLLIAVFALLFALPFLGRLTAGIIRKLFKHKLFIALANRAEETAAELDKARHAGIYGRMLGLSLMVRICKYGSMYWLMYALLLPEGYGINELQVSKVFIGLFIPEVAASLPVSGIGGFGVYELAMSSTFEFWGFDANLAKIVSVSHHLFTQVYGLHLGVLALLILLLPGFKKDLQEPGEVYVQRRKIFWPQFAGVTVLLVLVTAILLGL